MQIMQLTDEQLRQLGEFDSSLRHAEQAARQVRVKDRKERYTGQIRMTKRAERRRETRRAKEAKASRLAQRKAAKG